MCYLCRENNSAGKVLGYIRLTCDFIYATGKHIFFYCMAQIVFVSQLYTYIESNLNKVEVWCTCSNFFACHIFTGDCEAFINMYKDETVKEH